MIETFALLTSAHGTATSRPGRAARAGLRAPAYRLLLGLSTWTHQPGINDFDAYVRYITTDVFLISHLGASILGASLAVLSTAAFTTLIAHGRAHLTGTPGMPALNADIAYGPTD
jgi:hypothetical protein